MSESLRQFNWTPGSEQLLNDAVHPLLEQLGSPDSLAALNASSQSLLCPRINDASTLALFLDAFRMQMLYPLEWPAILQAYQLASHNQARELISLDRSLADAPRWPVLVRASRRVGQRQLQRLRPLRDHRLAKRYIAAVEHGEAQGWHTLVYGVTMAVYCLPVRQGLMNYARQTLQSIVDAAASALAITPKQAQAILDTQFGDLPAQLELLVHNLNQEPAG